MELAEIIEKKDLKKYFKAFSNEKNELYLVDQDCLLKVMSVFKDDPDFKFDYLISLTALDRLSFLEVVYQLLSLKFDQRLMLKVASQGSVPSLVSLWQSANFMEREVFDMFGIKFEGHPNLKRILMYDEFQGFPLRKDYPFNLKQPRIQFRLPEEKNSNLSLRHPNLSEIREFILEPKPINDKSACGLKNRLNSKELEDDLHSETTIVSFGPSHPATHGTVRIEAELVGETIIDADVEVGYLHRGFEKTAENIGYNQLIPYTDRLNYVSPLINNVAWCLTVENLLGVTVTKRAQYIRVFMSEISRVCDHLTCIGASAMELGAYSVMLYAMQAREYLWELIEKISGARLTASYIRIGGLRQDFPDDLTGDDIEVAFKKVRDLVLLIDRLLSKNRIFIDRMSGIAKISASEAINYGLTGPLLRASGVNYDVRKVFPYSSYDEFDFDIPLGSNGDNYDRYYVRLLEIEQSLKIAEQAYNNLPTGQVNLNDCHVILPSKKEVLNSIQGQIKHFKLITEGIKPPKGDIYFAVEGANGELGFYVDSDGSERPNRVHVRSPSFIAMGVMKKLLVGYDIADLVATFGMINMIGGECDR